MTTLEWMEIKVNLMKILSLFFLLLVIGCDPGIYYLTPITKKTKNISILKDKFYRETIEIKDNGLDIRVIGSISGRGIDFNTSIGFFLVEIINDRKHKIKVGISNIHLKIDDKSPVSGRPVYEDEYPNTLKKGIIELGESGKGWIAFDNIAFSPTRIIFLIKDIEDLTTGEKFSYEIKFNKQNQ